MKFKLLSVVGARPQFIKLAPIVHELRHFPNIEHCIVHTGQHYDYAMSQQFFDELSIPAPNYNLEVGSGRHLTQMAKILLGLDEIFVRERPDLVFVYGDTNSTAAAAIAAAKSQLPLAHLEAGLREFDKKIPEEINKLLTDAVSDLYFSPTPTGVTNLQQLGVTKNVFCTGDLHLDLIRQQRDKIVLLQKNVLKKHQLTYKQFYFATVHRADNTDNIQHLSNILQAFQELKFPVLLPLHPRTKHAIQKANLDKYLYNNNIRIIEPISFWETQACIAAAEMVLTDSGGVSKEAYFHQVPCVILQPQIEWIEIIAEGWAVLSGHKKEQIVSKIINFKKPSTHLQQLGNGQAAQKILKFTLQFLEQTVVKE